MPKVRSQRSISRVHSTSAKPVNRSFAVQDNAVQRVDVGVLKDVPPDEILHSVDVDASSQQHVNAPNKKERRVLKHELFIERLEASRAPYSKSHARRLKRKEKEELVGGRLGTLQAALPSIAPTPAASAGERSAGKLDAPAATTVFTTTITAAATAAAAAASSSSSSPKKLVGRSKPTDVPDPEVAPQQPQTRPGQIGEGKATPLTTSQRRRALKAERFRQPLIRSNPEFASNPFETIRTHARNTLIPHHLPTT